MDAKWLSPPHYSNDKYSACSSLFDQYISPETVDDWNELFTDQPSSLVTGDQGSTDWVLYAEDVASLEAFERSDAATSLSFSSSPACLLDIMPAEIRPPHDLHLDESDYSSSSDGRNHHESKEYPTSSTAAAAAASLAAAAPGVIPSSSSSSSKRQPDPGSEFSKKPCRGRRRLRVGDDDSAVEEKRERNRHAARKCRINNLRHEAELSGQVEQLQRMHTKLLREMSALKEEKLSLREHLLQHGLERQECGGSSELVRAVMPELRDMMDGAN